MTPTLDPARNRPTLGTLATGFVVSLISWGWTLLPDTVPPEVSVSGYALAVALVAYLVGQAVQHVGDRAPWADETHRLAVAVALSHDHEDNPAETAALLDRLGLDDLNEARMLIGLDPEPPA